MNRLWRGSSEVKTAPTADNCDVDVVAQSINSFGTKIVPIPFWISTRLIKYPGLLEEQVLHGGIPLPVNVRHMQELIELCGVTYVAVDSSDNARVMSVVWRLMFACWNWGKDRVQPLQKVVNEVKATSQENDDDMKNNKKDKTTNRSTKDDEKYNEYKAWKARRADEAQHERQRQKERQYAHEFNEWNEWTAWKAARDGQQAPRRLQAREDR